MTKVRYFTLYANRDVPERFESHAFTVCYDAKW